MCLICVDYKKLSVSDLIKNSLELSNTDPDHAEEFFYMLSQKDPEMLEKIEKYFWDRITREAARITNGR